MACTQSHACACALCGLPQYAGAAGAAGGGGGDAAPWLLIGIPSTPRAGVDYLNPTLDYLLEQFPADPDDPLYMRYHVLVVNNAHGRPHAAFDAARERLGSHPLAACVPARSVARARVRNQIVIAAAAARSAFTFAVNERPVGESVAGDSGGPDVPGARVRGGGMAARFVCVPCGCG